MDPAAEDLVMHLPTNATDIPHDEGQQQQGLLNALLQHFQSAFDASNPAALMNLLNQAQGQLLPKSNNEGSQPTARPIIPATIATGPGAAPLPSVPDVSRNKDTSNDENNAFYTRIHVLDSTLCNTDEPLPLEVGQKNQVLIIKRGECNFSTKLRNIPSYAPSSTSLQLLIVVSFPEIEAASNSEGEDIPTPANLIRPFLEEEQMTPAGMKRVNEIPMVLVDGGEETWEMFRQVAEGKSGGVGLRRRYWYESQGVRMNNLFVV